MTRAIIAAMHQLLPNLPPGAEPSSITVREVYDVPRPRPPGRPWIGLCMVASLDGSTVIDRRSAGLSSDTDREVLVTLRSLADVIIVGAGTVREEGYGPPSKAGQRVGVVSHSGNVDTSTPLFASGAGFLILPESAGPVDVDSVRAGRGDVDLAAAVAMLDADFVQAEGGPSLNGTLIDAGLLDELNLTIAPFLAGGDGPRLTTRAAANVRRMHLAHVLEDDGFLFTRYVTR